MTIAERLKRYETVLWLCAWYVTSLGTLLLNKIILTERGVSSQALGACQMLSTALLGALKVWWSSRREAGEPRSPTKSTADLEALQESEARLQKCQLSDGTCVPEQQGASYQWHLDHRKTLPTGDLRTA